MDDSVRKSFEKAIKKNPCDQNTRLVFADFLEENGFDDEATEHRRRASREWMEAYEWMREFTTVSRWKEEEYGSCFDHIMQRAGESVRKGIMSCGGFQEIADELNSDSTEFWKNWSIITGIPVSTEEVENKWYSCAC